MRVGTFRASVPLAFSSDGERLLERFNIHKIEGDGRTITITAESEIFEDIKEGDTIPNYEITATRTNVPGSLKLTSVAATRLNAEQVKAV